MLPIRLRLVAGVFAGVLSSGTVPSQSPPPGFTYETLSDGSLQNATAMAFLPDGRLLITERVTGNIRLFRDGVMQAAPWATVPVHSGGSSTESGLLGIAVDPAFLQNGYVYVYYTAPGGSETHISRLQEVGGSGANLTVLTAPGALPAHNYHNGGAMIFGHDGTLFVGTGDVLGASYAQTTDNWRGKILRFEVPDLTIPADNPFPNNAVWSYGHRNQFGLSVHPVSGDLYQTENGGGQMDEVNHIVAGGNYGWPIFEGLETTPWPSLEDPLAVFQQIIAPTGCCFYTGEHYPPVFHNVWFVTDWNGNRLRAITLDASGNHVVGQQLFDDLPGSGYAVLTGPDGNLWYLTNDNGGFGADELGRYVHVSESQSSVQISSVSNKTLGGSVTVCVHGVAGGVALPWLSTARYPAPLPSPWGNLWMPAEALLPTMVIGGDDRGYLPMAMPNATPFLGVGLHVQAVVVSPTLQALVTNASELVVRG